MPGFFLVVKYDHETVDIYTHVISGMLSRATRFLCIHFATNVYNQGFHDLLQSNQIVFFYTNIKMQFS